MLTLLLTVDPLPSWNDGETKQAILDFVTEATREGSPTWIEPSERIAVFDNDGTLWPENPVPFQLAFALDLLGDEAPETLEAQDLERILAQTHAGLTTDAFEARVRDWLATARHPRFDRPYTALAYQPMLELLDYLRDNGFQTWIVSGGGTDFMRVWAEDVYGIPPSQVIGSIGETRYELRDGTPTLVKEPSVFFVDDKEGKPVAIHRQIGERPAAAFGNSDGDLQMLQWTTIGCETCFGLIVHHTDAEREYAYDAEPQSSGKLVDALAEAPERGWVVVDMARDWKTVFSTEEPAPPATGAPRGPSPRSPR